MSGKLDTYLQALRNRGPVVLLESQSPDHPEGRVSYLAGEPEYVLHMPPGGGKDNPWDILRECYAQRQDWLFGFLGYDLKNHLEDLQSANPDPVGAPDLWFMQPGVLLEYRHGDGDVRALKGEVPAEEVSQDPKEGSAVLEVSDFTSSTSRFDYLNRIREAQERIREGDFYEINLSHQMSGQFTGDPFDLYRRMRQVGPVPFAAFMETGELSVCSLSPERFLARRGDRVFSQPIKGTVERGADPEEDRRLRDGLSVSSKDRAENLMIVDLVRNDLSRVARKESVTVRDLFQVQTFGTVHQMVSTVEARVDTDDPFEIIRACYPMGSMTGAPKISTMKYIEELENYRRGVYSGAIGYLDPKGNFDFNVVIRTALIRGNRLFYSVGGAITSDSDPGSEWRETLVKGRALTQLFG
ncbi:MAG: aminodeoxychorismate synthase component I [Balneolaceae bacterium]|nr:aminodeoxychorismate synthase component I [Balneolaceae bacterium]